MYDGCFIMDLCNIPLELKLMLTKCIRRFTSSTTLPCGPPSPPGKVK